MRTRSSGSAAEEEGAGSGSSSPPDAAGRALSLPREGRPSSSSSSTSTSSGEATATANASLNTSAKIRQPTVLLPIPQSASQEVERRKSIERRPSGARSRTANNGENWKPTESRHGNLEKPRSAAPAVITVTAKEAAAAGKMSDTRQSLRRSRLRNPWACSPLTLLTTLVAILSLTTILHSYVSRQLDAKGCRMSYMRPSFAKLSDFDTEHTRFASKYSTYLYREGLIDEDTKVSCGMASDKGHHHAD
jgi:glycosylphosphatidylinositol deacylase